jgi:hypothetical protein
MPAARPNFPLAQFAAEWQYIAPQLLPDIVKAKC